ncbi:TPA: O-antigen ligase family protein [Enterobacter cancerogenus]
MSLIRIPALRGPGRVSLRPLSEGWPLLPVLMYLILVLPFYFNNNAGSGLSLPQNLLAWVAMMLCVLLIALRVALSGRLRISNQIVLAALAVMLMMLPWLWTPCPLWQDHALPRLAGIAGALCVALALYQVRLSGTLRRVMLYGVVISALAQAIEAMFQAWLPGVAYRLMDYEAPLPYGIFEQRNVLASWLATGYGVCLYLALTARTRHRALVPVLALYPLCIALTLTSSRAGALGALAMTLLAALADRPRWHGHPLAALRRLILLTSLLTACAATALWGMPSGHNLDYSHTASTAQRLRVLAGTTEMIVQHPLTGSGLGSFESQFPSALEAAGLESLENDTFTHPHNEVMYVMAEGGFIALSGLLLLAGLWLWPVAHHLRRRDVRWLLSLTGLPIVIHMMTEYPVYQSAPHLMMLLLLYRAGLPAETLRAVRAPTMLRAVGLPAVCLCTCAALAVLTAGLTIQETLTRAEADMNAGLIPSLPAADWRTLTQAERLDYDRHMLAANGPGFARSPYAMAAFTVWGKRWLAVHNDAEVSAAMIFIARHRGDHDAAERLRVRAARVFVADERFHREGD